MVRTSTKLCRVFIWDWSCIITLSSFLSQISDDDTLTKARREGGCAQDPSGWVHGSFDIQQEVPIRQTIPLWIVDVHRRGRRKPRVIDSGLSAKPSSRSTKKLCIIRLIRQHHHHQAAHVQVWILMQCRTTSPPWHHRDNWSGHLSSSQAGTSSSSSLGVSPDRDSIKDYPEIGGSICSK
jgi:hypothetical protein